MSKSLGNHFFQEENNENQAPVNKQNPAPNNNQVLQDIEPPMNQENPDDAPLQLPQNIVAIEMDDDDIDGEELAQLLEKIEKENANIFANPGENNQIVPMQPQPPAPIEVPVPQNPVPMQPNVAVANFANISNVINKEKMPVMYFPGSNVTINYNFNK